MGKSYRSRTPELNAALDELNAGRALSGDEDLDEEDDEPFTMTDFSAPNQRNAWAEQATPSPRISSRPSTARVPVGARGPASLQGLTGGNVVSATGAVNPSTAAAPDVLPPPRHEYEFNRDPTVKYWHKVRTPSGRGRFNVQKNQYVMGSDRPIYGYEMGRWRPRSAVASAIAVAGASATGMPLDFFKRRASVTQRPIAIVSGTHGAWHSNNWDDNPAVGRYPDYVEPIFLNEDLDMYLEGGAAGAVLRTDSRGIPYYASGKAENKRRFESRIRVYDAATLSEKQHMELINDLDNHVIHGFCFGRNDESLRSAKKLPPVISYLSKTEPPSSTGKRKWLKVEPDTIVKDRAKNRVPVPIGGWIATFSTIDNNITSGHILLGGGLTSPIIKVGTDPLCVITETGGTITSFNVLNDVAEIWHPPMYHPDDPQAPSLATYSFYNP
ncbi:hypothetical protein [Dyella choica]|uniref:Uncharacterized protein n=1 Tax=Dyella choica TaxID=1927959 RepID=A0A432MA45_9GAMM|nr:hypothetical protein [Dyella choica]RUL78798.1 hypothetical protein EKH80_03020 [Dyella choica]